MKIGLVIPWRATPSRLKALDIVLDWYKTNLTDIEIFYGDRPGVWNLSASRNDGVKKAQEAHCDVIIVNDADTIPEIEPLMKAIQECQEDGLIHLPFRIVNYLEESETDAYLSGKTEGLKAKLFFNGVSGALVCKTETWWELGGQDEKFKQWGGEDDAFSIAHRIVKRNPMVSHSGILYCFGHAHQSEEKDFDIHYQNNLALLSQYKKFDTAKEVLDFVKQR
jgi:hypothetical protein